MEELFFDKWDSKEVKVGDPGLVNYINLNAGMIHSHGKHNQKQFRKSEISIVERMVNSLMRSGSRRKIGGKNVHGKQGCGQKSKAIACLEDAFEIIEKRTKENPIQVLVKAIENSAPREETTRVKMGGMARHIAVDIAPQRRVDFALRNIGVASLGKSFKTQKSWAEVLAAEIIAAANNESSCMSVSRKIEVERIAKGAR